MNTAVLPGSSKKKHKLQPKQAQIKPDYKASKEAQCRGKNARLATLE